MNSFRVIVDGILLRSAGVPLAVTAVIVVLIIAATFIFAKKELNNKK